MKSKVYVIKVRPETVVSDIAGIVKDAEINNLFYRQKTTILKTNISWHFPFPSANTTPWQLEGAIVGLKEAGFSDLVNVSNNTVVTNPFKGVHLNKLDHVLKKHRVATLYNFLSKDMKWVVYQPKTKMIILDKIYKEGIKIPDFFIGKNIVHLPTMKCHIYTTITGSMKNAFGGLLATKRHYTHTHIHETLVDLLAIQKEIHGEIFTITDGTTAGEGPGPRTMIPIQKDYILASADSVAIDAVQAKMFGFDPLSIKFISLAHQSGLGTGDLKDIEIIGENISNVNFKFFVGNNTASKVGNFLWFGPLKAIQHIFFRTPLVYLFIFASALYHDAIWWRFKGKKMFRDWKEESPWGRLFSNYKIE